MRRLLLTLLLVAVSAGAYAVERSKTLVYINGERYYVHRVESQQTIYSLATLYGVEQGAIERSNPQLTDGLKVGIDIKIPYIPTKEANVEELSRSERRRFDEHSVVAGETLYAIARKYEISVDVIISDNPSIDPIALTIGDKLLIRKREQGESDELKSLTEWERYRDNLNRVAPEGYKFHIVNAGETLYSLAREYGMSEKELTEVNDLSDGLKAGALITVIDESWQAERDSVQLAAKVAELSVAGVGSEVKGEDDELRIALFLPLKVRGAVRSEFAEFYKGFLVGLEDIKNQTPHRKIRLDLYNSGRDTATVAGVARSAEFQGTDLIVGPVYEEDIAVLLPYAQRNSVPIVSPLSRVHTLESDMIFQMASEPQYRYGKIGDLLSSGKQITFIHTRRGVDSLFYKQVLSMVEAPDSAVYHHIYEYEHADVARKLAEKDEDRVSPSDLAPFIANGADNTIVITSDNQTDVDRVLAALTSANTNQVARSRIRPRYSVLGNSVWNNYSSIDRSLFFSNGVVLFPSYTARRSSSQSVVNFDRRYIAEFGSTPSLYSYRGYDAAIIFVNGAYSDIEFKMQGVAYKPLESQYMFVQDEESGVIRNVNSLRVNYNKDFTITVE